MRQHPRTLKARDETNHVHTRSRRLWGQTRGKRARRPLNKLFERGDVQTHGRLDRQLILRHIAPMGLREATIGYFEAGLYQETVVEI